MLLGRGSAKILLVSVYLYTDVQMYNLRAVKLIKAITERGFTVMWNRPALFTAMRNRPVLFTAEENCAFLGGKTRYFVHNV